MFVKQTPQHLRDSFKKLIQNDRISFVRKKPVRPRNRLERKTKQLNKKHKIKSITGRQTDFDTDLTEIPQINIDVSIISNSSKDGIMNQIICARSPVDPKYCLLLTDLFTFKVYTYPMKNRKFVARKMQLFYEDVE